MKNITLGIIGLGYVGLPLAVEFGKLFNTIGYDTNTDRINDLQQGVDKTLEITREDINASSKLRVTYDPEDLNDCSVYIVTVPTPIDRFKRPDLKHLIVSSGLVGRFLKKGDIVIYESTVYPGCTEELCVPILMEASGLTFNKDFYCGYSPERINPGDKKHTLTKIQKVTSGSTKKTADFVDDLYEMIIKAGTFRAKNIKVAEASKVIENIQRDINIALINELSMLFDVMNIDTEAVLDASATKWNFLNFRPGLVGGHCIGVDPYYLTHKSEEVGYHTKLIKAGREINDKMHIFIVNKFIKGLVKAKLKVENAKILVLGLSFKENCPDLRNSKVFDVITELQSFGLMVDVHDPFVNQQALHSYQNINLQIYPDVGTYDGIILAVGHDHYKKLGAAKIRNYGHKKAIFMDVKYLFNEHDSDLRL